MEVWLCCLEQPFSAFLPANSSCMARQLDWQEMSKCGRIVTGDMCMNVSVCGEGDAQFLKYLLEASVSEAGGCCFPPSLNVSPDPT